MFLERLAEGEFTHGDAAGEGLVDSPVGLARLAGALLDPRQFAGGRFDLAFLDAVALAPGDVDRGEDVPHATRAGTEVGSRPGLVDQFNGDVRQVVDESGADESCSVSDPDEGVRGVRDLLGDDLADPVGRDLERGDDGLARADGDPGSLARIDADHRSPVPTPQVRQDRFDRPPGFSRVRTDHGDVGVWVRVGIVRRASHDDGGPVGEVVARFDGRERHAALAEGGHDLVVDLEVRRRDDDHSRSLAAGTLTTHDVPAPTEGLCVDAEEDPARMSVPASHSPSEQPDRLFVLVAGLYVAAILGPVAVALARRLVSEPGALYGVLLVAGLGGVVVGALAVRGRAGVAERLGDTTLAWTLVALPLVAAGGVIVASAAIPGYVGEGDVLLGLVAGFGAGVLGFVLVSMAKTRYAAWVLAEATVEATWSAPWPHASRRRIWYVAGVIAAVGVVAFVVGAYMGLDPVRIAGQMLVPIAAVLATVGRELTYRASDRGLEIRAPVARRVRPWSAFAGFRASRESIELVRPEPYRQSIRCDRAAIEDPQAVTAVLENHLVRLS